ncbi:hypothetical protein ABT56_22465, partial [Photobacterium aquae]
MTWKNFFRGFFKNNEVTVKSKHRNFGAEGVIRKSGHILNNYLIEPDGLPCISDDEIIDIFENDIQIIRNELNIDKKIFDECILPAFHNLIKFVHLVPASEYRHHNTAGGLAYHSVDVAKRALRLSFITHFRGINANAAETNLANSRWRIAAILAGLYHDAGKVVSDMTIESENGLRWEAYSNQTIYQWAVENDIQRYFIRWTPNRHQNHKHTALAFLRSLIPLSYFQWVEEAWDGKDINNALLEAIAGLNSDSVVTDIVIQADVQSVREDHLNRRVNLSREKVRVPIEELVVSTIRYFINSNKWLINKRDEFVWYCNDHIYVSWKHAFPDVSSELTEFGVEHPKATENIARMLYEHGYIELNDDGEYLHGIQPEILSDDNKKIIIKCIKFKNIDDVVCNSSRLYQIKDLAIKSNDMDNKPLSTKIPVKEHKLDSSIPKIITNDKQNESETSSVAAGSQSESETSSVVVGNQNESETSSVAAGSQNESETSSVAAGSQSESETSSVVVGNQSESETSSVATDLTSLRRIADVICAYKKQDLSSCLRNDVIGNQVEINDHQSDIDYVYNCIKQLDKSNVIEESDRFYVPYPKCFYFDTNGNPTEDSQVAKSEGLKRFEKSNLIVYINNVGTVRINNQQYVPIKKINTGAEAV